MAVHEPIERRQAAGANEADSHVPYVPDNVETAEFTWPAVLMGVVLGIVFGASSLYLVLKAGMTVSASIPVAVLSITLFRAFSRVFGVRRATILENNITQTTGSAGESIAFGVGVTIPALMLLGEDMHLTQVMTVGTLGGLLGILMMIPLRRAFIVKQHRVLKYPEGTACADVLIVGEQGGATAATVFAGFSIAFVYQFLARALRLWSAELEMPLANSAGKGLKGAVIGVEPTPELLGVGYIIGPRIASLMVAGGVLAYLVLAPLIMLVGSGVETPVAGKLIRDMNATELRNNFILYIGAGAVATGGIISMLRAVPLIVGSLLAGVRDMRAARAEGAAGKSVPRTARDMPLLVVGVGALALIAALLVIPNIGLGLNPRGFAGAVLIVCFGFLFVTVSARLTGEIGSSSNPISGMTVATLLITCLIFLAAGMTDQASTLTALMVAAIVCVASSNGGTTAQDLKTGYLVGATPIWQQWAILIGALTSASVIGLVLLLLNSAGTVWSAKPENLPSYRVPNVDELTQQEQPGGEYAAKDQSLYHVWRVRAGEVEGVPQGKYLVDNEGVVRYLVDPTINGRLKKRDDGTVVTRFEAPKTRLMGIIIDGVLNQRLPWEMVIIGALIALTLELAGTASLPFAVGVYLPLAVSTPIFLGGLVRWAVDKISRRGDAESDMSPGVLLSSGYIAGGTIAGVVIAFLAFLPETLVKRMAIGAQFSEQWTKASGPELLALGMFGALAILLFIIGLRKQRNSP